MDAAPTVFEALPWDDELGGPVPFACGADPMGHAKTPPSARELDKRRVTQCALSRVCGVCGASLGRPIAFLGSPEEDARNAFHFPPCHLQCAEDLRAAWADASAPVLGQPERVERWVLVTTPAFEFVRPGREDSDRRPVFEPRR